jgi:TPR repeat protein
MIRSMILALMISVSPLQDGDAQYALNNGMRHLNGDGVERDHHRALAWFYIAGALDHNLARPYIGLVEPYITPEQRGHARAQANRCIFGDRIRCNFLMQ